jgi:pyrimidine-nucleoside phosphorylase
MSQPLGRTAGNWIEVAECVEILRGERSEGSEDLRELSLTLAGWMIRIGGKATTPELGYKLAESVLESGKGLDVFLKMVDAQGGDIRVFEDLNGFHEPGATHVLEAWRSGFVSEMDTTALGWAVQRLGAGREKAGEPVDAHAGIEFHAKRGARVKRGEPFATLYATTPEMLAEPIELITKAVVISETEPRPVPLVSCIYTREYAESALRDAVR